MAWGGRFVEYLEEKAHRLNELINELDGVGPVDNRPSTNKLHHFVEEEEKREEKNCDMWQVTSDRWREVNIL